MPRALVTDDDGIDSPGALGARAGRPCPRLDVVVAHVTVGELEDPPEPDTDAAVLAAGHPTLTELTALGERPGALERRDLRPRR